MFPYLNGMNTCKDSDINFGRQDGVDLKSYFETILAELRNDYGDKIRELKEKTDLQFEMKQIALDKAESTTNIRLEGMNEFRNAMTDQQATFITKNEYDLKHEILSNKIDAIQRIMYIAFGIVLAVEFIFEYVFKFLN